MHKSELLIHRALCGLLDMLINRQNEIVARDRRLTPEDLDRTPRYIHLYLIASVDPAHLFVVDALQAELSDDIAGLVPLVFAAFELLLVDFAHIAKYMRRILPIDVVANRENFDDNAGIIILLFLNNCDNIRQHIIFYSNRIKSDMRVDLFLNLLDGNVNEF